jgi:hypothetical protein
MRPRRARVGGSRAGTRGRRGTWVTEGTFKGTGGSVGVSAVVLRLIPNIEHT